MRRLPPILAFTAVLLTALVAVWFPIDLDDTWWHLLTGRHILDHHQIPRVDPFSFTAAGAAWVNWKWLAGLLMTLAWDVAGSGGLIVLRFLAVGLTLAVVWSHAERVEEPGGGAVALATSPR